jgi:serine-type D-Ala-D-Ala carboxypeptidase/endopeptidase (penicillin-binding protein 4)
VAPRSPRRHLLRRPVAVGAAAGALAAVLVAAGAWPSAGGGTPPGPVPTTPSTAVADSPTTTGATTPTSTSDPAQGPTSPAARTPSVCRDGPPPGVGGSPPVPPPPLVAALGRAMADPGFRGVTVGASVWVEGHGEVLASGADVPLAPASTQKLLTAMGALSLFEADDAMTTAVRAGGRVADGVVQGDLVLVGGGDPTLTADGPHSLDALADQVARAGIAEVAGDVVGDESRHDAARAAPGWQDWQLPTYVGPMSALMVDDNRHRADPAYVAAPAMGNAALFRAALVRRGITVAGSAAAGTAPPGAPVVASLRSPPVPVLVADMLRRSDNEVAELVTREAALEAGAAASTPAGTAALTAALRALCLPLEGVADDGSGLSRADRRSAREWRQLLQAARAAPWWPTFRDGLPVAGHTGTLAARFRGTPAEGNLRAKTGTIIGGRALAGYLTTAGGRQAVFAVVANGGGWRSALGAIDRLVVTVAADRS